MAAASPVTSMPSPAGSAKKAPAKGKGPGTLSPSASTGTVTDYNSAWSWSTASLHQPSAQAAQSARAYLASSGALEKKEKAKTRAPEPPAVIEEAREPPTREKFTTRITKLLKREKEKEPEPKKEKEKPKFGLSVKPFAVSKKVSSAMRTLFASEKDQTKSMKWEVFVKVSSFSPDTEITLTNMSRRQCREWASRTILVLLVRISNYVPWPAV